MPGSGCGPAQELQNTARPPRSTQGLTTAGLLPGTRSCGSFLCTLAGLTFALGRICATSSLLLAGSPGPHCSGSGCRTAHITARLLKGAGGSGRVWSPHPTLTSALTLTWGCCAQKGPAPAPATALFGWHYPLVSLASARHWSPPQMSPSRSLLLAVSQEEPV